MIEIGRFEINVDAMPQEVAEALRYSLNNLKNKNGRFYLPTEKHIRSYVYSLICLPNKIKDVVTVANGGDASFTRTLRCISFNGFDHVYLKGVEREWKKTMDDTFTDFYFVFHDRIFFLNDSEAVLLTLRDSKFTIRSMKRPLTPDHLKLMYIRDNHAV